MKLPRFLDRYLSGEVGRVFRGMATLALGTGMARLIGIASIPILTRLYTPSDYGVLAVYVALVATVAPILTLRYVLAIPLPRGDAAATNLLALSALLMAGMVLIAASLLGIFSERILGWMSMEILAPWWWMIVLGSMAVAAYEAMSLWATRKRAYRVIAQTKVVQSLMGEGIKIGLGLLAFKPFGLLLGNVVEQSGGVTSFALRFRSEIGKNISKISVRRMRALSSHYADFPKYRLPSQFLLVFSTQAPALFSSALYGASATGQLGLALMALAIPANLIGQSVGQAFYGEIARLGKGSEEDIRKMSISVQKKLFAVGIPVTLLILLLGQPLFGLAFGPEWRKAGLYASMLSPFVLLQLTSAPLIQVLNIYNAQGRFLLINMVRTFGLLGIYGACRYWALTEELFVAILAAFLFAFYLFVTGYVIHMINAAARKRMQSNR